MARKTAKVARKEAEKIQDAITQAQTKAAALVKASAAWRKSSSASGNSKPQSPVRRQPVRKKSTLPALELLDAENSPVETMSNAAGASDGSASVTSA